MIIVIIIVTISVIVMIIVVIIIIIIIIIITKIVIILIIGSQVGDVAAGAFARWINLLLIITILFMHVFSDTRTSHNAWVPRVTSPVTESLFLRAAGQLICAFSTLFIQVQFCTCY